MKEYNQLSKQTAEVFEIRINIKIGTFCSVKGAPYVKIIIVTCINLSKSKMQGTLYITCLSPTFLIPDFSELKREESKIAPEHQELIF